MSGLQAVHAPGEGFEARPSVNGLRPHRHLVHAQI